MDLNEKCIEANLCKEKGNNFFKEGKFEEALKCYKEGLKFLSDE